MMACSSRERAHYQKMRRPVLVCNILNEARGDEYRGSKLELIYRGLRSPNNSKTLRRKSAQI